MFINFSNHPFARWSEEQKAAAVAMGGEVVDMAFPAVPSTATTAEVEAMADKAVADIAAMKPAAVLCQGEMTLAFAVVTRLKELGIPVVAACSDRKTVERQLPDGTSEKTAVFQFAQFRAY